MPPLIKVDNVGECGLPAEFKPRLDLWSSSVSVDNAWSMVRRPVAHAIKKKNLRFSLHTVEIPHIHVKNYTFQETEVSWYRSSDYRQFRQNKDNISKTCAHWIETGRNACPSQSSSCQCHPEEDPDECRCTTGLETPQEATLCQGRIREAINAVLQEQNYQRINYCEDSVCSVAIAERYGAQTSYCQRLARWRGQQLEEDLSQKVTERPAAVIA